MIILETASLIMEERRFTARRALVGATTTLDESEAAAAPVAAPVSDAAELLRVEPIGRAPTTLARPNDWRRAVGEGAGSADPAAGLEGRRVAIADERKIDRHKRYECEKII